MRMPIRLRVSWQDDTTLKFETDNGQQVRLFDSAPRSRRRASRSGRVNPWRRGRRLPRDKALRRQEVVAEAGAAERIRQRNSPGR